LHQNKSDAVRVHDYVHSVNRDCCECYESGCGRPSIGSDLPPIPWPVLSQEEQTAYIILAIALVALLWFLTAFVRAMLIVLATGGLSLFWAYWIHVYWPRPVPVAFFAALIVATIVVGRKLVDAELNPKKPSSGAHSH